MYDLDTQKLYIAILLANTELFIRTNTLIKEDFFDTRLKKSVNAIMEYYEKYNGTPNSDFIKTKTGLDINVPDKVDSAIESWFMDEFPKFCLHKALENAVIESSKFLADQDYDQIEKNITAAMQTRLVEDYGLNYHENAKERLKSILERSGNVSSGFEALDEVVGKINYGDLIIYAGGSGSGKSLMLQNNSIYHWTKGKHVIYITLELHPELCARRMDAMYLERSTSSLYSNLDSVSLAVKNAGESSGGSIHIKYMPSGTKTSEIKSFIKDYILNKGIKPDVIAMDYLDLIAPVQKVSTGDTHGKDKAVSEELRNMLQELNIIGLTASQLNRTAVGTDDLDHSHIAGGISKINTADLVLGIIITDAMREKGVYELQVLKTRNSAGTGRRIRLKYLTDCMKIMDDPEFLADMNAYRSSGNKTTQLTAAEKQYNIIQNELNKESSTYDPVNIETGVVIPKELNKSIGSERLSKLKALMDNDDDNDV